jgi:transcriptional regulator with XRE-family HTH domain
VSKRAKPNQKTSTTIDAHVGARLRALRRGRGRGVTQSDLGAWLGVSYTQVQKYERGIDRVSAARLFQIARIFKVPIGSFFEGL